MQRILALIFLVYLNSTCGYCQILINPSLTVEDFEIALTDSAHLKQILEKHNFEYSAVTETKLFVPGTMANPLLPDLRAVKAECWEPKNQGDQSIVKVSLYEWKPDYAPHPEVIKTIRVLISRNPIYADQTNEFFEEIKNKYPNRSKRYFRNNELYKFYGESFNVFTNNSKIEVRTETEEPIYSRVYIVNFDLIRQTGKVSEHKRGR
jgi:hypothetical protein